MKTGNFALLLLAGASLVALAGCNKEDSEASRAPEPPAAVEPQTPGNDRTDDAMRRITEGADAIMDGATQLGRDARQRTEQLIEDAGPTLDRLRDMARELGVAVNQITERAVQDFQTGLTLLQQRIDESRTSEAQTGDPAATLPPVDQLRGDTRLAAQARTAGVGPDYVGVWASDAIACGKVDFEPLTAMAVITPTTIRLPDSVCNFAETPLTDGAATLAASCIADDEMEDIDILLEMPNDNALTVDGDTSLIRCRLPE